MDHELNFITREDLKNLNIPKEIIQMIPRTVAEAMGILPFGFSEDGALLVASGDPKNTSIKEEVKNYTGIREVRIYHGFRTAVMDAIHVNYERLTETLASEGASPVDFGSQYFGTDNDIEAFPGVFGKSSLEEFVEEKKEARPKSQGVSGSLVDMPVYDIIQVLAAGRKSAVVILQSNGNTGQVHLREGNIINAFCGDKGGEEAFYEMVGWIEGDFKVDPEEEIGPVAIDKPNDALILEGLRRLDEARNKK